MPVVITRQPTGTNYINRCAVWGLSITGVIDETTDERGLYRLMSSEGPITEYVSLPPIGFISVNFSKEIAGALSTPIPGFAHTMNASSMKKQFWLEYGSIVYDKSSCTKTSNTGQESSKSDFVNGVLNGGQPNDFNLFTTRPDYMIVPKYGYYDYIYSDAPSANFKIKLCDGTEQTASLSSAGDITAYGVGTLNSPVTTYIKKVVWYEVTVGSMTYRFRVVEGEARALNDWKVSGSMDRVSTIMFLEPSGGYSCIPVEYLESMDQNMSFDEICVYDDGCGTDRPQTRGDSIHNKTTEAQYEFSFRSPRTQQFGLWVQHFAASGKYFVLMRDISGNPQWTKFIVTSISRGYHKDDDTIRIIGHLADGLNPQL